MCGLIAVSVPPRRCLVILSGRVCLGCVRKKVGDGGMRVLSWWRLKLKGVERNSAREGMDLTTQDSAGPNKRYVEFCTNLGYLLKTGLLVQYNTGLVVLMKNDDNDNGSSLYLLYNNLQLVKTASDSGFKNAIYKLFKQITVSKLDEVWRNL